jgi:Ankyrin repeats (3 copies)
MVVPAGTPAHQLQALLNEITASRNPSARAEEFSWTTFINLALDPAAAGACSSEPHGTWSALHATAFYLKPEYCAALLARGADPNAVECSASRTPLHVCMSMTRWYESDALATARVLLRYGADVDAVMEGGKTPLIEAVSSGSEEMVRLVLEAGAAVGATVVGGAGGYSFSALYLALYTNREEIVRSLLEAGASVEEDRSDPSIETLAESFEDVRLILEGI